MKEKLYKIIDSFLVEAKTLDGRERSVERLNQDRHLAVEAIMREIKDAINKVSKGNEDIGKFGDGFENAIEQILNNLK